MTFIPYTLAPVGNGWRLSARGFYWYFESRTKAVAFSLATARDFALATGQPTCVRVQADDGTLRELRTFGSVSSRFEPWLAKLRAPWA